DGLDTDDVLFMHESIRDALPIMIWIAPCIVENHQLSGSLSNDRLQFAVFDQSCISIHQKQEKLPHDRYHPVRHYKAKHYISGKFAVYLHSYYSQLLVSGLIQKQSHYNEYCLYRIA